MKRPLGTKKILLMGGTTEGRELFKTGLPFVYSAATEYGAKFVRRGPDENLIMSGRMDESRMLELLRTGEFAGVVDATHPYAAEVKLNIQRACETAGIPLFRVLRPPVGAGSGHGVTVVKSWKEAAGYIERANGNALLTIGSKELHNFVSISDFKTRLYVRILPSSESIATCERLGFPPSNIIAELGPFSESANRSHLEKIRASILVTKDGGQEGGVPEKLAAARKHGAEVLMIARPSPCDSLADVSSGSVTDAWSWALSLPGVEREPFGKSERRRAARTRRIRVGSRESVLAVAQARSVIDAISICHPEFEFELVSMKTKGDRFSSLFPSSGISSERQIVKGMFVKELESALLDESIDLAVHSLKDISLEGNPDLPIVAYTAREDPRDAAVARISLRETPSPMIQALEAASGQEAGGIPVDLSGFIAGCSSPRRRVQLRRAAKCGTNPVRGNVLTRLERLDSGDWDFDFLVLAAAGLIRLGMRDRIDLFFPVETIIPAAGQGILACQGRAGEDYGYLSSVNDPISSACAAAERAFASATGGGCSSPVAAYAKTLGGEISLLGLYVDEERDIYSRGMLRGSIEDAKGLGERLALKIMFGIDDGGRKDE
ncbi:MAG: precorrin-6A reductase [Synergistaceae bacterium]|jgi:hydroxymethylbilane synthase|nr:precorrin-6A reductase [Synergistaceae bacterium]